MYYYYLLLRHGVNLITQYVGIRDISVKIIPFKNVTKIYKHNTYS